MKPIDHEHPYPVLYRYVDGGGNMPYVYLQKWHIIRETPKGYWLQVYKPKLRFVLKSGYKRFAHPTIEEAKTSFLKRKCKQLEILNAQVYHVNLILGMDDCFTPQAHCSYPFDFLHHPKP